MSMSTTMRSPSCPCPPPHHHHRRTTPALELLDEYWFFSNTLACSSSNTNKKPPACGSPTPISSKDRHGTTSTSPRFDSSRGRRLLRTPSLPPPRPRVDDDNLRRGSGDRQQQQPGQDDEDDDDLNWSSIYEGVLRTRIAEGGSGGPPPALRRAPSMPVPSVKPGPRSTSSGRSGGDDRQRSNKWRSSGDLESISSSRRPPALVRVQSAAEMKDQLRMWAQAVACNVRRQDS